MKRQHEFAASSFSVQCSAVFTWILQIGLFDQPLSKPPKVKAEIFTGMIGTPQTLAYNPNSRQRIEEIHVLPGSCSFPAQRFEARSRSPLAVCASVVMENTMLSPHEFATLLLVQEAPNQVDMEREELDALLERQLVQLEQLASGRQQWRLTATGDSTIKAFKRFS